MQQLIFPLALVFVGLITSSGGFSVERSRPNAKADDVDVGTSRDGVASPHWPVDGPPPLITFRQGHRTDMFQITKAILSERMNPLGLDPQNFLLGENRIDGQEAVVVGWGQIKPLGIGNFDTKFNASPGSGSIEKDIDEDIWLDFEDDGTDFPNGLASLPWSPSYRQAALAAAKRRERRAVKAGKVRMNGTTIWEMSSIFVYPQFRSQGIGKSIVRKLLSQHTQLGRDVRQIFLLTLRRTCEFYVDLGFEVVKKDDEIPAQIQLEISAGRIITKILGEELVCLRYWGD